MLLWVCLSLCVRHCGAYVVDNNDAPLPLGLSLSSSALNTKPPPTEPFELITPERAVALRKLTGEADVVRKQIKAMSVENTALVDEQKAMAASIDDIASMINLQPEPAQLRARQPKPPPRANEDGDANPRVVTEEAPSLSRLDELPPPKLPISERPQVNLEMMVAESDGLMMSMGSQEKVLAGLAEAGACDRSRLAVLAIHKVSEDDEATQPTKIEDQAMQPTPGTKKIKLIVRIDNHDKDPQRSATEISKRIIEVVGRQNLPPITITNIKEHVYIELVPKLLHGANETKSSLPDPVQSRVESTSNTTQDIPMQPPAPPDHVPLKVKAASPPPSTSPKLREATGTWLLILGVMLGIMLLVAFLTR